LVTACVSCTNAFQQTAFVHHYLELLFGIHFDWPAIHAAAAQATEKLTVNADSNESEA